MPVLEKPVDSAQDVLDRGLIPVVVDGGGYWQDFLKSSSNPLYQALGEITVVPDENAELMKILKENLHEDGTHVYLTASSIFPEEEKLGSYHFSREVLEGAALYGVWLANKKWLLVDELGSFLLMYQQVRKEKMFNIIKCRMLIGLIECLRYNMSPNAMTTINPIRTGGGRTSWSLLCKVRSTKTILKVRTPLYIPNLTLHRGWIPPPPPSPP